MKRYGEVLGGYGETLCYTFRNGKEAIIKAALNDGNYYREDRKNIFSYKFTMCGIASGKHNWYENVMVIDFAECFKAFK